MIYRKATIDDLEILTETRIEVLRAANQLGNDVDMSEVKKQSYKYYQNALKENAHLAYLIFDESTFVGAGGISYFQVMPTYHNPTGVILQIKNVFDSHFILGHLKDVFCRQSVCFMPLGQIIY